MTLSRPSRRLERLFYCLISALLVLSLPARGAEPNRTIVADTIYRADGAPARGTILISWPAFSTADAKPVAAGSLSVKIAANGSVNIPLIPTQGATPAGTAYKVVLALDDGATSTEYWAVPALSPTTIAAIRSTQVPATVAMQVVSREYVDAQLATAVRRNGDQSIDGVKDFAQSPLVPSPGTEAAAANKGYVDVAIAAAAPTPSNVLNINKGGTGTGSFPPARCVRVANDGSQLEAAGGDCGTPDADTVDGRHGADLARKVWTDPREFGCLGDQVADDSACVQAAFNATPALGSLRIPPGFRMRITQTINIHNRNGILVTAESAQGNAADQSSAGFYWDGPDHGTLFSFNKSRGFVFRGVSFNANLPGHTNAADVLMEVDATIATGGEASLVSDVLWERCGFWSTVGGREIAGLYIARHALNNIEDLRVKDSMFNRTDIHVGNSANTKNFEFVHNWFQRSVPYGLYLEGFSGSIRHNYFASNSPTTPGAIADIYMGGCSDPSTIDHNLTESAHQFFVGNCVNLAITNNNFDVGNGYVDLTKPWLQFGVTPGGSANGLLTFANNHFDQNFSVSRILGPAAGGDMTGVRIFAWGNNWPNQPNGGPSIYTYTVQKQFAGLSTVQMEGSRLVASGAHSGSHSWTGFDLMDYQGTIRHGLNLYTGDTADVPGSPCGRDNLCLGDGEIEIAGLPSPNIPQCVTTGDGSVNYSVRLVAHDAAGKKSYAGATAICSGAASPNDSNYIVLNWLPVTGAASYDVLVRNGTGSTWGLLATTAGLTHTWNTPFAGPYTYALPQKNETAVVKVRGASLDVSGLDAAPFATSGQSCSGTDLVKGVAANGTLTCQAPAGSGGGVSVQSVVSASRLPDGTVYHNTDSTARFIAVSGTAAGNLTVTAYADAANPPVTTVAKTMVWDGTPGSLFFVVLPGHYYKVARNTGSLSSVVWVEWH